MTDGDDQKVGRAEHEDIQAKEDMKRNVCKVSKSLGAHAKVAMVIAMTLLQVGRGETGEEDDHQDDFVVEPDDHHCFYA